jgi:hypothetical protein
MVPAPRENEIVVSMKTPVLFFLLLSFQISNAQVPILNSCPQATATVFLDFDGAYVTATSWNWNGDIIASPASLPPSSVTEIFNRVAEDYSIFNINITTDSTEYLAAPSQKRIRVIITPSSSWYGNAGGVSFIGSFTWGDDTPAWVFSQLLSNNVKYIAEACSHETGHTLGLQHQSTYDLNCNKTAEYSAGQGNGEISWAPIMGVGYYKNLTTWYNGKSAIGCNYFQDDIAKIVSDNGFGLRKDDYGDVTDQSNAIAFDGSSFRISGMINSASDQDMFKLVIPTTSNLRLFAIPQHVANANSGADVDLKVTLLDVMSDTIGTYNPSNLLNAGVDTTLDAGTYYLVCEGVGNLNAIDYGSVGHYFLTGTVNAPLPVHYLKLKGREANNYHVLDWKMQADEPIKEFEIQLSNDGISFSKLFAVGPRQFSAAYLPPGNNKIFYRVKAITVADEIAYYSNIVSLPPGPKYHTVKLLNSSIKDIIRLFSDADCSYTLMIPNGQIISKGKILKGTNNIASPGNVKGLLLLRIVFGNEVWTEKIMKQ